MKVRGVVESFDDRRGDGVLRSEDGARLYFHCVDIADGSRHLDVGVQVRATRHVGLLGRDEAVELETI